MSLSAVGAGWSKKSDIDEGFIIGGVPAVVFRPQAKRVVFHFELGVMMGYSRFTFENDLPEGMPIFEKTRFVIGAFGSTSLSFDFSGLKDEKD